MIWVILGLMLIALVSVLVSLRKEHSAQAEKEVQPAGTGGPVHVSLVSRMRAWFANTEAAGRDQFNINADTLCINLICDEAENLAARAEDYRTDALSSDDAAETRKALALIIQSVEALKENIRTRANLDLVEDHLNPFVKTVTEKKT